MSCETANFVGELICKVVRSLSRKGSYDARMSTSPDSTASSAKATSLHRVQLPSEAHGNNVGEGTKTPGAEHVAVVLAGAYSTSVVTSRGVRVETLEHGRKGWDALDVSRRTWLLNSVRHDWHMNAVRNYLAKVKALSREAIDVHLGNMSKYDQMPIGPIRRRALQSRNGAKEVGGPFVLEERGHPSFGGTTFTASTDVEMHWFDKLEGLDDASLAAKREEYQQLPLLVRQRIEAFHSDTLPETFRTLPRVGVRGFHSSLPVVNGDPSADPASGRYALVEQMRGAYLVALPSQCNDPEAVRPALLFQGNNTARVTLFNGTLQAGSRTLKPADPQYWRFHNLSQTDEAAVSIQSGADFSTYMSVTGVGEGTLTQGAFEKSTGQGTYVGVLRASFEDGPGEAPSYVDGMWRFFPVPRGTADPLKALSYIPRDLLEVNEDLRGPYKFAVFTAKRNESMTSLSTTKAAVYDLSMPALYMRRFSNVSSFLHGGMES